MERNPHARCGNCVYFVVNPDDTGMGQCRHDPPRPFPNASALGTIEVMSMWPPTEAHKCCGKHPLYIATDDIEQ